MHRFADAVASSLHGNPYILVGGLLACMRTSSQPLLFDSSAGRGFGASRQIYSGPDIGTLARRRDAVNGASGRDINAPLWGFGLVLETLDHSCPRPERAAAVYRLNALTLEEASLRLTGQRVSLKDDLTRLHTSYESITEENEKLS